MQGESCDIWKLNSNKTKATTLTLAIAAGPGFSLGSLLHAGNVTQYKFGQLATRIKILYCIMSKFPSVEPKIF